MKKDWGTQLSMCEISPCFKLQEVKTVTSSLHASVQALSYTAFQRLTYIQQHAIRPGCLYKRSFAQLP